ncbi:SRPBCC domain-containing protein [Streptomyces sp. NPDC001663]|uniref:SRPBCC domain-containing protein n=1 Tax=unclassified Streptomyces TaxID=2593676 RepID=UPI00331EF4F7
MPRPPRNLRPRPGHGTDRPRQPSDRGTTCDRLRRPPGPRVPGSLAAAGRHTRAGRAARPPARWWPPDGPHLPRPHRQPGKTSDASDVVDVTFADLMPPQRVVQRVVFEANDPSYAGTMTMTWHLTTTSEGTEVTVTATDIPPASTKRSTRLGSPPRWPTWRRTSKRPADSGTPQPSIAPSWRYSKARRLPKPCAVLTALSPGTAPRPRLLPHAYSQGAVGGDLPWSGSPPWLFRPWSGRRWSG